MLIIRRAKNKTQYTKRYLSLSSNERMDLKSVQRCIKYILLYKEVVKSSLPQEMEDILQILVADFVSMQVAEVPTVAINRRPVYVKFDDVDEDICYNRYRFLKKDLWRLHQAFRLDQFNGWIICNTGTSIGNKFGTEEALLILLHRLAFPTRYVDMVAIYGREGTALSRIFNWMNNYIRTTFGHLIANNLDYWKDDLEEFTESIREKVLEKSEGAIHYPPGSYLLFGFIDDTTIRTCRPGGGPAEEGEYAERYSMLLQEAFYSGYKKHHGIKFQSVELPNGMCADLFGPKAYRESDVDLLTKSGLIDALAALTRDLPKQYSIYGDGVFPIVGNLISKHVGNTTREDRYVKAH